jgi:polyhydroxyalkanoate synthesis regulator phasin
MSEQENKEGIDKLVDAYERILKHTHESIEDAQKESIPRFREMLDKARDQMVELGELSREEAQKVSDYVRRDVEDAASYIAETGQDIRDWWRFDMQVMEQRMMEMFARVADQTSLQLAQWAESARQMSLYQAGEVTGPGTLVCDKCGAETHFVKAGRIPTCADCGGTTFTRRADEDSDKTRS